jgi:hypothetical protein
MVGQKGPEMLDHGSTNSPRLPISRPFYHVAAREATLKLAQPAILKAGVKWKVLIMRQILKQDLAKFHTLL